MPTVLKKPIIRRIDSRRLVIRVTSRGVELRGYRRRNWKRLTWEQIAGLSSEEDVLLFQVEHNEGRRLLTAIETGNERRIR